MSNAASDEILVRVCDTRRLQKQKCLVLVVVLSSSFSFSLSRCERYDAYELQQCKRLIFIVATLVHLFYKFPNFYTAVHLPALWGGGMREVFHRRKVDFSVGQSELVVSAAASSLGCTHHL
jgi:hypothetical protein